MKDKYSKRYKKLIEMSKDAKTSKIEDVIGKVKKNCTAKFNESIDISLCICRVRKIKRYSYYGGVSEFQFAI